MTNRDGMSQRVANRSWRGGWSPLRAIGQLMLQQWMLLPLIMTMILWFSLTTTATAAPPPAPFTGFEMKGLPQPITAVQIVGCDSEPCSTPVLLTYAGTCTAQGCLSHPSEPSPYFGCHDTTCVAIAASHRYALNPYSSNPYLPEGSPKINLFRLGVQAGDRLWVSHLKPIADFFIDPKTHWQATATGTGLLLNIASGSPVPQPKQVFAGLGLTLAIEAAVFGVGLWRLGVGRTVRN